MKNMFVVALVGAGQKYGCGRKPGFEILQRPFRVWAPKPTICEEWADFMSPPLLPLEEKCSS